LRKEIKLPRKSAEERAATAYRAGGRPPAPPSGLDPAAAKLWRAIAASRPVEWFSPATLRLLRRFCRTAIYAERLHDALDAARVGGPDAADLLKQVLATNASLGILAAKMRLTTQAEITAHNGLLNERGPGEAAYDPLLGGGAIVPIRRRRR
jgi:hypothetical protein